MTSTDSLTTLDTLSFQNEGLQRSSLSYKMTRSLSAFCNAAQMTFSEAYINGLEVPDSVMRTAMHAAMPIFFKYFPGLLAPYEWVLTESDRVAESSKELMKLQYDLPQAMFNQRLGSWDVFTPSTAWVCGNVARLI